MNSLYSEIFEGAALTREQSHALMNDILEGTCNEHVLAAFLGVLRMRGIRSEELHGFSESVLGHCRAIDLSTFDPIDICGTGGDGKNTFNISTLAAFVIAAAGYPVAKHGNYGASSIAGSSNILEASGVPFSKNEEEAKRSLDHAGICFLHAPHYHPALKSVAPVRKNLGFRSIFNLLGPLCNPARPKKKILGVSNLAEHRLYREVLAKDPSSYAVIFSRDGYDEVSLTGPCLVSTEQYTREFTPESFGLHPVAPESLHAGNSIEDALAVFKAVITGNGTPEQHSVVVANAALGIERCEPSLSLAVSVQKADTALRSGDAYKIFEKLRGLAL